MRYPTHRNGLIIPPYEIGYGIPTEADRRIRRRTNIHHAYWPWSALRDEPIKRVFGSLITNTYPMFSEEHNMGQDNLHADYSAPRLPDLGVMVEVVDEYLDLHGVIDCISHKKTSEIYQVTRPEWQHLVGRVHVIQ